MNTSCVSRTRCLAVWLASGALLTALAAWVAPLLGAVTSTAIGAQFDQLLLAGCAVGALLAAGWLWLGVSVVTARAWRGRPSATFPGIPEGLLRLVLAGCGVALTGGLALPGAAVSAPALVPTTQDRQQDLLHGLPLPDRAAGRPAPHLPRPSVVEVRPGDTLWGLAAHQVPSSADPAATSEQWHRIYAANRSVIGSDPDLILPGQQLRLPPTRPDIDQ